MSLLIAAIVISLLVALTFFVMDIIENGYPSLYFGLWTVASAIALVVILLTYSPPAKAYTDEAVQSDAEYWLKKYGSNYYVTEFTPKANSDYTCIVVSDSRFFCIPKSQEAKEEQYQKQLKQEEDEYNKNKWKK